MTIITCFGEPLIEFSPQQADSFKLGIAGDVLNTAAAMASLGLPTQLLTALGDDNLSQRIIDFAESYGVATGNIPRQAKQQPGLYIISNDESGERFFSYWRSTSAAKLVLSDSAQLSELLKYAESAPYFYLSGISLALMSDDSTATFLQWCEQYRANGKQVIYDNNYRPLLWNNKEQVQQRNAAMLEHCDIFLPSLEDQAVFMGISEPEALEYLAALPIAEVVIKQSTKPLLVIAEGTTQEFTVNPVKAIDTTGAGDGFNAGYLATRLQGGSVEQAANAGMQLSAATVQHRGAILPQTHIQQLNLG